MIYLLEWINKYALGWSVPLCLMGVGIFYCVRLKFFHVLHPVKVVKELFGRKEERASSAKALALALAGTLGVGNMVGVASAITLGGFGAIFWMWISAIIAMILKYAEIVLAVKYRKVDSKGRCEGSAMLYIKKAFGGRVGTFFSVLFAAFCTLNAVSMGGMLQINAAAEAIDITFGIPRIFLGGAVGIVAFFALMSGRSGILSLTEKLVPFMSVGFILLSLSVICLRPAEAVNAFRLIFEDAFSFESAAGGALGFLLSRGIRYGTMRGILSNEAGCGTSPAAHATAKCTSPARQGLWGILEVFADTIILCTMTAVVIIISYDSLHNAGGYMSMTIGAYTAVLGRYFGYFLAFAVLCFAVATVLCWGYYGMESVRYLSKGKKGLFVYLFVFLYSLSVILGSVLTGSILWETSDVAIGSMTLINLAALLMLNREVVCETRSKEKGGEI